MLSSIVLVKVIKIQIVFSTRCLLVGGKPITATFLKSLIKTGIAADIAMVLLDDF